MDCKIKECKLGGLDKLIICGSGLAGFAAPIVSTVYAVFKYGIEEKSMCIGTSVAVGIFGAIAGAHAGYLIINRRGK